MFRERRDPQVTFTAGDKSRGRMWWLRGKKVTARWNAVGSESIGTAGTQGRPALGFLGRGLT